MDLLEKLKSRKLLVFLATGLAAIQGAIPAEIVDSVLKLAMAYIVGQGAVDTAGALRKPGK